MNLNHAEKCLCFECYQIRRAVTELAFVGLRQDFNNTIENPIVNLPTFAEILLKKELDKQFDDLMTKLCKD